MATTIKLKNGSGAPLAGDLVQGEPALDLTNKRLYTENASGTVIEVGTNPTSLTTGTFTSTGIDDNATSTAITIDSSQNVGIGTSNATPSNGEGLCIGSGSTITRIDMRNTTTGDATGDGTSLQLNGNNFTIENREAGYVAFSTSLTERMRIDGSGNVGINTTNPLVPLHVETSGTSTTIGDNAAVTLRSKAAGRATTLQFSDGANANWISALSGNLGFATNNTERMRIDASGNVGIGTTSPSGTRLNVHAAGGDQMRLVSTDGASPTSILMETNTGFAARTRIRNDSGNITFVTSNTLERMRIDSSGNVGIGTTSPSSLLDVSSGTNTDGTDVTITVGGTSANTRQSLITKKIQSSDRALEFYAASGSSSEDIRFFRDNTNETMRIDSSGNVGIGTTSPLGSATERTVHIASSATNTYATMYVTNSNNSVRGYIGVDGNLTQVTLGTQTNHNLLFQTNNTERVRIDTSGNLKFDSGYGSVVTAYGCRAWVNFNGTTASVVASGNVSSITDNAAGQQTVNFATAMPDANYAATMSHAGNTSSDNWSEAITSQTTTSVQSTIKFTSSGSTTVQADDRNRVCIIVVR